MLVVLQLLMQEQVVHVPKVVQQERVSHQQVEQVVEVHVPMTRSFALASLVMSRYL